MSRRLRLFFFVFLDSLISLAVPLAVQAQTGPSTQAGQDINNQFFDAVAKDNLSAVRALLAKGADVNAKDGDGATPLGNAISYGRDDMVKLLLENGAALNIGGIHDPLYLAAFSLRTDVVGLLLRHGANINATLVNSQPLLTFAVQQDRPDVARFLLANGADVNVKGSDGDTPLLKVVCSDIGTDAASMKEMFKRTTAKLLVEYRANVNVAGPSGTALQCAEQRRMVDGDSLVRLLKAAGATGDLPPSLPSAPAVGTYYVDEMMTDTLVGGPFSTEDACKIAMTARFGANAQRLYICVSPNHNHGTVNAAQPSSGSEDNYGWHGPGWYVEEGFLGVNLMAGPYPDQATCSPVANQHRSEWDTETGPYGCFYWDHDPDK